MLGCSIESRSCFGSLTAPTINFVRVIPGFTTTMFKYLILASTLIVCHQESRQQCYVNSDCEGIADAGRTCGVCEGQFWPDGGCMPSKGTCWVANCVEICE